MKDIRTCDFCKTVFTTPRLSTQKEFSSYYPQTYYSYTQKYVKTKKDTLILFLYKLFWDSRYRFHPLRFFLFFVRPFVRGSRITLRGKVLDVGAGSGFFLQRMRDLNMSCYAIELGTLGYNACKRQGFTTWNKEIFTLSGHKKFFDLITFNSVMEHIDNVNKTLSACHALFADDGLLIIQVPNLSGFSSWIFGKYLAELDIPRHFRHFTIPSLTRYLYSAGFKVVKTRRIGSTFQFTQSLAYRYKWFARLMKYSLFSTIVNLLFMPLVILTNMFFLSGRVEIHAKKK